MQYKTSQKQPTAPPVSTEGGRDIGGSMTFTRAEWEQERALMERRLGRSPEERLRWLINFTQQDLDVLRQEEKEALVNDLLMLWFIDVAGASLLPKSARDSGTLRIDFGPLLNGNLVDFQAEINRGIRGLMAESPQPWKLPPCAIQVIRVSPPGAKTSRFELEWDGGGSAGVVGAIINLLLQAGGALRPCAECGSPLVARKRQIYCSAACSQKVRDRKRPSRAKA